MCEHCSQVERELRSLYDWRRPLVSERPSNPATPHEELVAAIEKLGSQGTDLSTVKSAIDRTESEYKASIEKSLVGVADLAKRGGAKIRRFIVAYWYNGKAETAEGVEYPDLRKDSNNRSGNDLVFFQGMHGVVHNRHNTMQAFRESLAERKIPFHIVYVD